MDKKRELKGASKKMSEDNKNKYVHNDDGTTHIFVETKNKYWAGKHTIIIDT